MLKDHSLVEIVQSKKFQIRYWSKVRKGDGCWIWTAAHNDKGYGRIYHRPVQGVRTLAAHRASWIIANGAVPDGLFVCHRCDVRDCVNPAHLFLGTNRDNMIDCEAKGRGNHVRGEKSGRAKLNTDQVHAIRSGRERGRGLRDLADQYGVNVKSVYDICRRKNWKHV